MNKALLLFVLALCSTSSSQAAKNLKKTLDVKMRGKAVEGIQAKSKVIRTTLKVTLEQQLFENIDGKIETSAKLETGSNSSTLIDEFSPQNRIGLGDSYLRWRPFNFLSLKMGSLGQTRLTPLLVLQTPFSAIQEYIHFDLGNKYTFYLSAQQAIPNNDALAERLTTVEEGTPSYFTQTIGLKLPGDLISLEAFVKRFVFNDLSGHVANQSRFLGNSIIGTGDLNSTFLYHFEGYYFFTDLKLQFLKDWEFLLWVHYLYNDKAPDNRNSGTFFGPALLYQKNGFGFNIYENQSDSAPAFYTNNAYPKNTKGLDLYYQGEISSEGLEYRLHWVESKLLRPSIYQADRTIYSFEVRKKYSF